MKLFNLALAAAAIAATSAPAMAVEHLKSVNPAYIDNSIPAGDDFYNHVNKGWMEAHPLTPEYARFGIFNILADSAEANVKEIVLGLGATNPEKGTNAFKVWTLYSQGMDSVRRNAEGAAPILDDLKKIENTTHDDMKNLMLWMHKYYANPFFSAGPMEDMADSNRYAMYISGGSMGLGDRDYYLLNDKENTRIRDAYKKLIVNQMINAGYKKKDATRIMKNVLKIETAIADSALTREESRNIVAMYNPRSLEQLKADYPNIDWSRYFVETMDIDTPQEFILTEPKGMKQADNLLASLTDREIKDYYLWKYVAQAAPYLSDKFTDTAFEFSKVKSGVQQQRPRWKRALGVPDGYMGEAIGRLYVEKHFPETSKQKMLDLVGNLKTALGKHIINLPWMTDETKLKAIEKLNSFTVKIGYPDKWKDYSSLTIDPSKSYWENVQAAIMFNTNQDLADFGKPVDKERWFMSPQTVNAYYNPTTNEICFPAGILQAPYFNPDADDAENYGAIGVVIGHEMTHGFDDQGRQFDKDGNFSNWWTDADAEAFTTLADKLVAQFDAIEVAPGVHANGRFTLGENIADHGGLRVAYTAYHNALGEGNEGEVIDGFTPDQRFYLAYANVWAGNIRDAEILKRTKTDPHSLGRWRVNASLRNLEPFFRAFNIKAGDPMFLPENERVVIW